MKRTYLLLLCKTPKAVFRMKELSYVRQLPPTAITSKLPLGYSRKNSRFLADRKGISSGSASVEDDSSKKCNNDVGIEQKPTTHQYLLVHNLAQSLHASTEGHQRELCQQNVITAALMYLKLLHLPVIERIQVLASAKVEAWLSTVQRPHSIIGIEPNHSIRPPDDESR